MFEYLGTVLVDVDPGFDVLRYLTVRTIAGTVTALPEHFAWTHDDQNVGTLSTSTIWCGERT